MGQGEGHRDAPTIRGNASTADFFVDGMRDDAQYFRDFYNIDRIEALGGANALTFGRGGGGGVLNRVTRRAHFGAIRDVRFETGAWDHRRGTVDVGGPLLPRVAGRLNALYQESGGFRQYFGNTRIGVSPQLTMAIAPATTLLLGGEYFSDERTVDRGVPSERGFPSDAPVARFFGQPDSSHAEARVGSGDAVLEHAVGGNLTVRSHLRLTHYDKFYQNVYPGSAVDTTASTVRLSAYNSGMLRTNVFSQNEVVWRLPSERLPQTLLIGVELGRQSTDNVRRTGYFNGTATSYTVPFDAPAVDVPVEFRPSATDADNAVLAKTGSFYAQDQLWLTSRLQATLGARIERFDLRLRNNRTGEILTRRDDLFAPRAGLLYKPAERVSLYSSLSVSHLPSAGDQFSSLTPTTRTLEPERFTNREVGAKWDLRPALSLNAAVYRLDRTNSAAPSAIDPGVYVQTGRQRTTGYEVSLSGEITAGWDVVSAVTVQRARILSRTVAAAEGATVPLVPRRALSLWNRVQALPWLGVGLGVVHQGDMFAAIDNTVTLPGFTRVDGAVYLAEWRELTLQLNVENLLDRRYFATSHGNNNIMPGSPRTFRLSVRAAPR